MKSILLIITILLPIVTINNASAYQAPTPRNNSYYGNRYQNNYNPYGLKNYNNPRQRQGSYGLKDYNNNY